MRSEALRTGAIVAGGIGLAGMLTAIVLAAGPEHPLANPPLGVAAPIDHASLDADADIAGLERGRSYYAQLCIDCHGPRGDGLGEWAYRVHPRPADLTGRLVRERSDAELRRAIADGLPGTPMRGWGDRLSPVQIGQVVSYVRYLAAEGAG